MSQQIEASRVSCVEAVILDYGEVVSLPPDPDRLTELACCVGISPHKFRTLYPIDRLPYDAGLVEGNQYWLKFAAKAGVRLAPKKLPEIRRLDVAMWSPVNPIMLDWIASLRAAGFKTALLSNMISDMALHARQHFAWLNQLTCQVLSCEMGLTKPDRAIFEHCLKQLGTKPNETLFVDDVERNVEAARMLGLRAIRFQSVDQLREELIVGGLALPLPKSKS